MSTRRLGLPPRTREKPFTSTFGEAEVCFNTPCDNTTISFIAPSHDDFDSGRADYHAAPKGRCALDSQLHPRTCGCVDWKADVLPPAESGEGARTEAGAEVLVRVRTWFDRWATSKGRMDQRSATTLPEFQEMLNALVEDFDRRHALIDNPSTATPAGNR